MKVRPRIWLLAAFLLGGCAPYASVSRTRPSVPPGYAQTPLAVGTEKSTNPLRALGDTLRTADLASRQLARHPENRGSRDAYDFAVARVITLLGRSHAAPWSQPMRMPSAGGDYLLTCEHDHRPEYDPSLYEITPADELEVKGTFAAVSIVKPGLGAPVVAVSRRTSENSTNSFTLGRTYYGLTALVRFDGQRHGTLFFRDPLAAETVNLDGRTYPLAGNFTAPLAVALVHERPQKLEIARAVRPGEYADTARIVRLQPYDPDKTVVLFVHGLISTAATWAPMLNTLRGDPAIRRHYQFWFYSYPSGYPYPYSASILRDQLDAVEKRYPLRHKIVLVGHSMGSLIARLMITDSSDKLWLALFGKPPAETRLQPRTRALLEHVLIFRHRPEVGRVIFISGPHRGSVLAAGGLGRFGASLIHAPAVLLSVGNEMRQALTTSDSASLRLRRIPNSVDTLAPNDRFVQAVNTVPLAPGIPCHSIMGDRGKGGNKDRTPPVSTDGVVPYWSSHLDGAQSELIVPSGHGAHQNPQAINEVDRILRLHAEANQNDRTGN